MLVIKLKRYFILAENEQTLRNWAFVYKAKN